jgi:hypothetical protein
VIDFSITLTGLRPLLHHNANLANPLDPGVKEIQKYTRKRTKTDEDHEAIARLEHRFGMYFEDGVGPYLPGENIARCLVDGAKLTKQGTAVTRSLVIKDDVVPLSYLGPRTIDELYEKGFKHMASVKIGTSRTMRCRPWFPIGWRAEVQGIFDPSVLELADLEIIARNAGLMAGIGDWRPRFGRFDAEVTRL